MRQLVTPSLRLDPLARADFPWLFALYADAEVMRYIGTGVRTEEQSGKNLEGLLEQGRQRGFGYWVLRDLRSNQPLGGALLMVRKPGAPMELGFLLARSAWGRGIATEAARALVDHTFGDLEVPLLQAFTDPANAASMAVLRKAGLRDTGVSTGPYGTPDRTFQLTRAEWLAARAGRKNL